MSSSPAAATTRATALATFDAARDAFLAAFAQAPDESLPYVPQGDEYAIGTLLPHLVDVIDRYMGQFERMRQTSFAPLDLAADAAYAAQRAQHHTALAALRPAGADRAPLLTELAAAHQRVRETLSALDDATFARQAPIIYSAGTEPYPTAFRDIVGWLTGHYDEHTVQVVDLVQRWRAR